MSHRIRKHNLLKNRRRSLAVAEQKELNIKRIVEANKRILSYDDTTVMTTAPEVKPYINTNMTNNVFRIGDYVEVSADFSAGYNRPAGCGYITKVETIDSTCIVSIKYTEAHDGGRTHGKISSSKIIPAILHQDMMIKAESRNRVVQVQVDDAEVKVDCRTATEILLHLLSNNNRRTAGWHRRDLMLNPTLEDKTKSKMNKAEKTQLYVEAEMVRTYHALTGGYRHSNKSKKNCKLIKRRAKHDYHSLTYLLKGAWGLKSGRMYLKRLKQELVEDAVKRGVDMCTANVCVSFGEDGKEGDVRTVIDSYELAELCFTAKYMYVTNKVRQQAADLESIDRDTYQARLSAARLTFDTFTKSEKEEWEQHRKHHLRQWGTIKSTLMRELRNNNAITYQKLSSKINYWCSDNTISKWVKSREGYKLYTERIIPLLSDAQKLKHYQCAVRIRTNWGLGKGRYLWIHYDEKWFWGLVLRKNAKTFWDLPPAVLKAYHKSHISKVMGICTIGYAFVDNVENGGIAVKIDLSRCQSHKVAGRLQRASRRNEEGKIVYDGEVLRRKGDLYLADCNVTGSKSGTADDPKFSLLQYFFNLIFPAVKDLVKVGGQFAGYKPIFQGDNAGPHQDAEYKKGVENMCEKEGWKWIPQGPQMPHVNVCDLSVFPNMSKRHTQLSRDHHGMHVLKENEIWSTAEQVFKQLPSSKIAAGFIQAYRLSKKIIDSGGDNLFLSGSSGGIRTGVSIDYQATDKGLERKDGRVLPAPEIGTYHEEVVDSPELVSEGEVAEEVGIVQEV